MACRKTAAMTADGVKKKNSGYDSSWRIESSRYHRVDIGESADVLVDSILKR
ncbi:MAG: hypothetical protein LUF92_06500 [Clostridiales bacterium]|nr:hypothetical protein [Clostridiales bacterium]